MKYTVYCYTNLCNYKRYIGISTRPNERKREHLRGDNSKSLIHKALNKYGIDGFKYEILAETNIREEAFELEKNFIQKFGSHKVGYNMTTGGENGPSLIGSEHPASRITEETAQSIIDDSCSASKAAKKYKVGYASVLDIRTGRRWKHLDRSNAPIYEKIKPQKTSEKIVFSILSDSCSNLSASEKYKVPEKRVSEIRTRKTWKHLVSQNVEYDRDNVNLNIDMVRTIILDPRSHSEVAAEHDLTRQQVYNIRKGYTWASVKRDDAPKYEDGRKIKRINK